MVELMMKEKQLLSIADLTPQESAEYVTSQLGLDPGRFLLVLGTGANGANNHIPLLEAMHNAGLRNIQVLALCSRNQELSMSTSVRAK